MKPIGKVTHYYDNLQVAIVELKHPIKLGDHVMIERDDNSFEQTVTSIHKDHKSVEQAGDGDIIGLKVEGPAQIGSLILLLES